MGTLTLNQRHRIYRRAAERTGIHSPLLTALYRVQCKPRLADGETGLGISPAHQIALQQIMTFKQQVEVAASTLRALTSQLTVAGWKGKEIWDSVTGSYTDAFVQTVAQGFLAPANDVTAARLESCHANKLLDAYRQECQMPELPLDQSFLETVLLEFVAQVPVHYLSLPPQQAALLEAVRLWFKQDDRAQALAILLPNATAPVDDFEGDRALLRAIQPFAEEYAGYPHQREALLLLVQRWRQLATREQAIATLAVDRSPAVSPKTFDAALMTLIQQIPYRYEKKSEQRSALLESFQQWQQLETRGDAMIVLGVNPALFATETPDPDELAAAANLVDRALLDFFARLPATYQGTEQQRSALFQLAQRWYQLLDREQTIWFLARELNQQATTQHPDLPPLRPPEQSRLTRPSNWTPTNLQLDVPIVPGGDFLWADATQVGVFLPTNQASVDAIIEMAGAFQSVQDRLERSLRILYWYCPVIEGLGRGLADYFALGDAIAFYCPGYTAAQLYWFLDAWWLGGLGYSQQFPYLCFIDNRSYRARWYLDH
ncbi:MAG TPA: peptidase M15A [Leptolyngbyaceae cyanobacterium M33_DOE_097]|uniref:Peptidase M15A n=1 Tax=Oscillatoriales cyanobacterium SpSt-418 TaxID=2282169 RepID=A0A7C3PF59_9CYAN|nr:peptidase M15A [Leptolyngbyaceae cyanobacterium M33_DOE_097]